MSHERGQRSSGVGPRTPPSAPWPPHEIGKAAGTNSTLRELGGVFGIAVAVAVFAGVGGYSSAQMFNDGFVPAIAAAAGLSIAGAAVGLRLPARRRDAVVPVDVARAIG